MFESIYTKYNIDESKLKRDYEKEPLYVSKNGKGSELPSVDELQYLYLFLNLSRNELAEIYNVNVRRIERILKQLHINKSQELQTLCCQRLWQKQFGANNPMKNTLIKNKAISTMLQKYGVINYSQTKEWKEIIHKNHDKIENKKNITQKLNKTFNTSLPEKKVGEILKAKFPKTIYQYSSVSYPFKCDFYIPEIDTYIECNFHWTHGGKVYNELDKDCKLILQKWKSKNQKNIDVDSKLDKIKVLKIVDFGKMETYLESNL